MAAGALDDAEAGAEPPDAVAVPAPAPAADGFAAPVDEDEPRSLAGRECEALGRAGARPRITVGGVELSPMRSPVSRCTDQVRAAVITIPASATTTLSTTRALIGMAARDRSWRNGNRRMAKRGQRDGRRARAGAA